MRIGFDEQIFNAQRVGGISRYFVELIAQFDSDPVLEVEASLLFRYTTNAHLLELDRDGVRRPPFPRVLERATTVSAANRVRREPSQVDLVHHTYYPPPRRWPTPTVCTVHDMIPELAPEYFPRGNPHRFKEETVASSAAVICVSEATRRDLFACYGDIDKPVYVAHHGVSSRFAAAAAAASAPARPDVRYVLYVGTRAAYKNFSVTLVAFADLLTTLDAPARLLCIGGGAFTPDEQALMRCLSIEDHVTQRSVTDAALPGVYAAATAFVFPSRHEGFGLPILEAMAAGCPAIVADTPVGVETGGDAAAFFDTDDHSALTALLDKAFADSEWSAERRRRGMAHAQHFSWAAGAAATAHVYRSVLSLD